MEKKHNYLASISDQQQYWSSILHRSIGIDINLRFNTSKKLLSNYEKKKKNIGGGNNFTMASISFDFLQKKKNETKRQSKN